MSVYILLKFIHIASIAIWFGGALTTLLIMRILAGTADSAGQQAVSRPVRILSMRLFMPAAIVTLITGIGLVQVGKLDFGSFWVTYGMTGLVVSALLGGVFTGAASHRLAQKVAAATIDAAGIKAAQKKIFLAATINVILLLSIIFVMVAKP